MVVQPLKLVEKIGQGHFGQLYRARSSSFGNVAVKRFDRQQVINAKARGGRLPVLLQREIEIHKRLQHPHIIKCHDLHEDSVHLCFVLELAPGGDLLQYLNTINGQTVKQCMKFAQNVLVQIAQAVDYLQAIGVAHRDIKPENILIWNYPKSDDNVIVKMCDFGWAVRYKPGDRRTTLCGTPEYVPPEMLTKIVSYDPHYVDRWAMGVLAYELVHGQAPFGVEDAALTKTDRMHVLFAQIRRFPGMEPHCNVSRKSIEYSYADLVALWMRVTPASRMSMRRSLAHPFLHDQYKKHQRHFRRENDKAIEKVDFDNMSERQGPPLELYIHSERLK